MSSEDSDDLSASSQELSSGEDSVDLDSESDKRPVKKVAKKAIAKKAAQPAKRSAAVPESPLKTKGKQGGAFSVGNKRKNDEITESKRLPAWASGAVNNSATVSLDITKGPPLTTDIAAKKLIVQYLRQQNRPYSAIQINDNLHKRIAKSTVERLLTSLSSEGGGVLCKEYGKAKIYYVDQNTMASNFTQQELEDVTEENEALKETLQGLQSEEKRLQMEVNSLRNEPTDEELER